MTRPDNKILFPNQALIALELQNFFGIVLSQLIYVQFQLNEISYFTLAVFGT